MTTTARIFSTLVFACLVIPLTCLPPARAQSALDAPERFDYLVRADFLAGAAGDPARLERAMKRCEEALAQNPRHAEALVWHGSGLLVLSGRAFRGNELERAQELWARGLAEMNRAVALAPDNVGVLIPRAATLSQAAREVPFPEPARTLLQIAVADYERVLALQTPHFGRLSVHDPRGAVGGSGGGLASPGRPGQRAGVPRAHPGGAPRHWLCREGARLARARPRRGWPPSPHTCSPISSSTRSTRSRR